MSHLNKKALGMGVAMVALSSFVPNPFLTGDAWAQASASDTLDISAKVVNPLGVDQQTELDFGTFAVKSTGSYTIDATGGGTAINSGVVIGAGAPGAVNLTAPQNASFTLSIPELSGATDVITLKVTPAATAASKTLFVDELYFKNSTKMAAFTETFSGGNNSYGSATVTDAGGIGTMAIGGKLNFTADNIPGNYSGSYTLIATF
jgi:hypothetical protein